jgi:hypothetical protein
LKKVLGRICQPAETSLRRKQRMRFEGIPVAPNEVKSLRQFAEKLYLSGPFEE